MGSAHARRVSRGAGRQSSTWITPRGRDAGARQHRRRSRPHQQLRPPRACKRSTSLRTDSCGRRTRSRSVWDGQTPMLSGRHEDLEDLEMGLAPLAIVVIVLGVAAILATAVYFVHRDTIEVEGRNVRTTSILGLDAGARAQAARADREDRPGALRRLSRARRRRGEARRALLAPCGRSAVASSPRRAGRVGLALVGRQRGDGRHHAVRGRRATT